MAAGILSEPPAEARSVDRWARAPPSASHDEGFHLADECIHGFEDGMCAICFPPKEPEPKPVVAVKSRSSRAGGVRTGRPPARVPGAPHPSADAAIDAKAMRIYHVTHLDNLARILGSGALLADAAEPGAQPEVDIAAPAAREFRRSAELVGTGRSSPTTCRSCSPPTPTSGTPCARLPPTLGSTPLPSSDQQPTT